MRIIPVSSEKGFDNNQSLGLSEKRKFVHLSKIKWRLGILLYGLSQLAWEASVDGRQKKRNSIGTTIIRPTVSVVVRRFGRDVRLLYHLGNVRNIKPSQSSPTLICDQHTPRSREAKAQRIVSLF